MASSASASPWREVQLNPRSATPAQDLRQSHTPLPPFPRSVIMSYAAEIPSNFFPRPSLVSHFWYVCHCFAWQYESQNHLVCTFLRTSDGVQLNIQNKPSSPTLTNHSLSVISVQLIQSRSVACPRQRRATRHGLAAFAARATTSLSPSLRVRFHLKRLRSTFHGFAGGADVQ